MDVDEDLIARHLVASRFIGRMVNSGHDLDLVAARSLLGKESRRMFCK